MKEEILSNLDNPKQLEKLFREHESGFRKEFNSLYDAIRDHSIASFWKERLSYESNGISWGRTGEFIFVLLLSLLAGIAAKLPELFGLNEEPFYTRNIGFLVFPMLIVYFSWKKFIPGKITMTALLITLGSLVYINLLPPATSDTLILACIHLPLFLWMILGFVFTGNDLRDFRKRVDFLRYNGDLVVITALILIAGGALTAITIGLFSLIGLKIEDFYFRYIVIFGLPIAPIIGTWLTQTNPQLVNKVTPVIARIFSPLVLVTLVIYVVAMLSTGKNPYNDREFLIVFNALLIGVMALILFSVAGNSQSVRNKQNLIVLLLLSVVTIVVNATALSAIMFRISEWGITPNRLAVLGANLLILINLLLVSFNLLRSVRQPENTESVEKSIAYFLPIYSVWTMIVIFIFPVAFNFN